jgi:hypothetical protein
VAVYGVGSAHDPKACKLLIGQPNIPSQTLKSDQLIIHTQSTALGRRPPVVEPFGGPPQLI